MRGSISGEKEIATRFECRAEFWHNLRPNASADEQLHRAEGEALRTQPLARALRQTLLRLGCDSFEVYEQVGSNWAGEATGRYVQIMRFRDKKQQQIVQDAERTDPAAQELIREYCELINFPYQQEHGLFAVGFYNSVLATGPAPIPTPMPDATTDRAASDTDIAEALSMQSEPSESGEQPNP